ncbi:hypothetical protein DMUE_1901 [Dictyocoela muelleri]|nr:hypothetical protein DMUE_1901 [Dictyocoela muelleri]
MSPQIISKDQFIIISNNQKLQLVDKKMNIHSEIDGNFFIFKNFLTKQKQLFKYDENLKLEFICDISRQIYAIDEIEDDIFYLDNVGNLYKIIKQKEEKNITDKNNIFNYPILISGNFCAPRGICILNKHIFLADKYGRIRKINFDGEIKDVYFCNEIIGLIEFKNHIVIFLKDKIIYLDENFEFEREFCLEFDIEHPIKVLNNSKDIYFIHKNDLYRVGSMLEKIKSGVIDFDLKNMKIIFIDENNEIKVIK